MTAALARNPDEESTESGTFTNRPVHSIRVGSVTASIWRNQKDNNTFYSATYKNSYKDAQGQWHDTDGFTGVGDNLELQKAADMAATKIIELQQQARSR
jgi:hypothetical protein